MKFKISNFYVKFRISKFYLPITLLLILARAIGIIHCSWWWVFLPVWGLMVAVMGLALLVYTLVAIFWTLVAIVEWDLK